jgi:hypothetical protein
MNKNTNGTTNRSTKKRKKLNYKGINTNGMTHRGRPRPRATKSNQMRPIAME